MTEIFFTRKLDGSDKNIRCIKCNRRSRINSSNICYYCHDMNSQIVNSGNINIDSFIKGTLSPNNSIEDPYLTWVPFEEFKDLKKIGQGGFSQIFKATWKINKGINYKGIVKRSNQVIVLKVLNDSQNMDIEFLNELKHTFQFRSLSTRCTDIINCYGVTQDPQTKNYAFVLEYIPHGDLHHFIHKNFQEFSWKVKAFYLYSILTGIKRIHGKEIIHRDLHSGNILAYRSIGTELFSNYTVISDLGFSQPANIDSNLSRESQIYGVIPYMAPELFKYQPYSYASDIYKYIPHGDLHHFIHKNFQEFSWKVKAFYLYSILTGIKRIHGKEIIHRDLHSGNILAYRSIGTELFSNYTVISDLGFSQPANIDSNLSRESQIYGVIPYMAPELFKYQPYSYASDIYSLGMIMWQLTSGHRPFHDQEHGPKLILDILDGRRPEITEDTPERWANVMKRCWNSDPSERPELKELFICCSIGFNADEAEKKRLEMIKTKKSFVKNPGYEHPNSRYYSTSLNSMLETINSTGSDIFSNDYLLSNDHFDIMDYNPDQKNNFEDSDHNPSEENSKKHFLNELLEEEIIKDQNDFKRRKIVEYFNECFVDFSLYFDHIQLNNFK
ncbi:hypothetical protein Glove_87g10 [Diversispora epigaea]|uniref:Protein kinase domain-containing protein n=1 Tax=Diversispora epigaea TaxID=1348612 RepID=A0A397J8H2_9GLOM|nr:hypothetical protein Glove_87g10 [Diversispora epigaea]